MREKCRTHGRTPTAEALELAGWLILVTNAPAAKLPTAAVGYVYRLRWQIDKSASWPTRRCNAPAKPSFQ